MRILLIATFLASCAGPGGAPEPLSAADKISIQHDISFGPNAREVLDVYQPANPGSGSPVLIFFYGGGWRNGDKKEYAFVGQTMAARGVVTVVCNYRLYPQAGFPEFLDDGADAVAWVVYHAAGYGGDPHRIFLMGHSTGGYIAVMLGLNGQYLQRDGLSPTDLAGVIGLAGLYDFSPAATQEYAPIFRNAGSPAAMQPLAQVTGRNPPMLLMAGTNDDVVPPQNTTSLAARIRAAGGRVSVLTYPDIGHIGIMLPFSPLSHNNAQIVDDVTAFIFANGQSQHGKGT